MTKYIYCFIRKDLPIVHQIIQLAHAAHLAGNGEDALEEAPNLVLFEVNSENELKEAAEHLLKNKISYQMFKEDEPVLEYTAICTQIVTQPHQRAIFKDFKLYRD
jgi:hypothetical protein